MYWKQPHLVEAHALSVFESRDEMNRARDLNPLMGRKSLAEFRIGLDQGRAINTPSADGDSHHDWWTEPEDLTPDALVIEEKRN